MASLGCVPAVLLLMLGSDLCGSWDCRGILEIQSRCYAMVSSSIPLELCVLLTSFDRGFCAGTILFHFGIGCVLPVD